MVAPLLLAIDEDEAAEGDEEDNGCRSSRMCPLRLSLRLVDEFEGWEEGEEKEEAVIGECFITRLSGIVEGEEADEEEEAEADDEDRDRDGDEGGGGVFELTLLLDDGRFVLSAIFEFEESRESDTTLESDVL